MFGVVQMLMPIRDFIEALMITTRIDPNMIQSLMKIVGIGLIGEISSSVCADSGNTAIGKTVQLASTTMILYLSLPLFTALLELLERIMGNL
jgi:stage III sporulation protein AD